MIANRSPAITLRRAGTAGVVLAGIRGATGRRLTVEIPALPILILMIKLEGATLSRAERRTRKRIAAGGHLTGREAG